MKWVEVIGGDIAGRIGRFGRVGYESTIMYRIYFWDGSDEHMVSVYKSHCRIMSKSDVIKRTKCNLR
jgi:hypothetical protein